MAEENPQNENLSHLQLLTVRQLCETYGLNACRVRQQIRAGIFQAVRKPGSGGKTGRGTYLVIDPGWTNVSLSTNSFKKNKELPVEEVYLLTGKEVATILGVNPRTVRKMAENGIIGFKRTGVYGRSHRRYCLADVRKVLGTRKSRKPTSRPKRSAVRAAVLKWVRERLELPEAVASTPQADHPPETNT